MFRNSCIKKITLNSNNVETMSNIGNYVYNLILKRTLFGPGSFLSKTKVYNDRKIVG